MDLSVVIVNYNVKFFLEQCLLSVEKASAGLDTEIWVVDNHSTDGSIGYLKSRFPKVHFIENSHNEGFAGANNKVIRDTTGEYVLFLNPDTIVPEDCFRQCLDFLKQYTDAGGLGVRMIDGSGRFLPESKRAFPSPAGAFFKVTGLHRLFPDSGFFSSYYSVHTDETGCGEVDVLPGAFFMIARDKLYEVGGFDTDYFMYGEDIDLSYRLQKAGYKNYYLGSCTIIHFKGESTQKKSRAHIRHFYGAMNLFIQKHYRGMLALLMKAGIFFSQSMALLSLFLFSRRNNKSSIVKRNIYFIGSSDQYDETIRIFKQAGINADFAGMATGWNASVIPTGVDTVILHEGVIGFKQIILLAADIPAGFEKLIRASGSTSLVGSGSKNDRGITISQ